MIYLLRSYLKGGDSILKIGFTADQNKDKRLGQYYYHNPGVEILVTILEATEEHEKSLHNKFHHLLYDSRLNEWFKDTPEIVDYLSSVTLEELNELNYHIRVKPTKQTIQFWKENKDIVNLMISRLIRIITPENTVPDIELVESLLKEVKLKFPSIESTFRYIISKEKFSKIMDSVTLESLIEQPPQEVIDWLIEIESTQFRDKMRNICISLDKIDNEPLRLLLINHIPEPFKTYYISLGPDYISSLSYQKSELDRALVLNTNFSLRDNLDSVIKSTFKEGDRLTKADLKIKLGEIYKQLGINKSPKANDIESWFTVRTISIYVYETKKKAAGFELVSLK